MADLVELADYATKKLEASQAQRVPLTASQVAELLDEAGYSIWDMTRADFINGIRHGERAHGIKLESDFQVMKTEITPRNEMLIFCRYHGTVHPELVLDAENDEVMEVVILKREDQLGFPLHDQLFKQTWESVL